MHVAFHDGAVYEYRDVPMRIYREFMGAKSIGGYFGKNIRKKYPERIHRGASR